MGVLTKKIQIILFLMRYGLVFYSDYLLQISFKVRYNLFRIILPTDSHPIVAQLQGEILMQVVSF